MTSINYTWHTWHFKNDEFIVKLGLISLSRVQKFALHLILQLNFDPENSEI